MLLPFFIKRTIYWSYEFTVAINQMQCQVVSRPASLVRVQHESQNIMAMLLRIVLAVIE